MLGMAQRLARPVSARTGDVGAAAGQRYQRAWAVTSCATSASLLSGGIRPASEAATMALGCDGSGVGVIDLGRSRGSCDCQSSICAKNALSGDRRWRVTKSSFSGATTRSTVDCVTDTRCRRSVIIRHRFSENSIVCNISSRRAICAEVRICDFWHCNYVVVVACPLCRERRRVATMTIPASARFSLRAHVREVDELILACRRCRVRVPRPRRHRGDVARYSTIARSLSPGFENIARMYSKP